MIDAAAQGAGDGLRLVLNIGAMLIAFLALIAMLNGILHWGHTMAGWLPESLEKIFGVVFAPVAWIMGVPWRDASVIGNLLGTRLVTNEFVAFVQLGPMQRRSTRVPSPSPPMPCAASPTSVPSPFRSAASARWRPTGSRTWRGSGCGRWRREAWLISCRRASRECSYDRTSRNVYRKPHGAAAVPRSGARQRPGRFRGRVGRTRGDSLLGDPRLALRHRRGARRAS